MKGLASQFGRHYLAIDASELPHDSAGIGDENESLRQQSLELTDRKIIQLIGNSWRKRLIFVMRSNSQRGSKVSTQLYCIRKYHWH